MPTIWPFPPRDGMTEGLEFSTDILRAFSTEQRIRRTDIPRRRFSCSYAWTERVYETARALMRSTHPGPFEIPDWAMWQKITVEAGTSLIPVDTSAAKYVDRLIIMDRYDAYEAFDIVSVTDAGVTIDGAVSRRFRDATVAPLIEAYAMQGLSAPRTVQSYIEADVEWVNFTGPDLIEDPGLVELGQRTIAIINATKDEGVSNTDIIAYDTESIDQLNAWDASDPERLNVQSGVDFVQLIHAVGAVAGGGSSKIAATIVRNGTSTLPGVIDEISRENFGYTHKSYIGYRIFGFDFAGRVAVSPVLAVTPGEWFLTLAPGFNSQVGGLDQLIRTSMMMYRPATSLKRALVKPSGSQFASQNVNDYQLAFDTELYDTDGFWNPTSPLEFSVPENVTTINVAFGVEEDTVSSSCHGIEIRINGTPIAGNLTYPSQWYNAVTGPVRVEPGDRITFHGLSYFQYRTEPGFPPARDRTYLPNVTFAYVEGTVGRSAAVQLGDANISPSGADFAPIIWPAAQHDDLGYWDGEFPERLTVVTAGWHQVGASLFATTGYVNDTAGIRIDRYSSDGTLIERFEDRALNTPDKFILLDNYLCNVNLQSQHILCNAGDYFIASARVEGAPASIEGGTRFWIQDFKGRSEEIQTSALGEYLGHPLLNHCAKLGDGSFAENVQHLNNMIDNGIALPFFDTNVETPRQIFGSAWQTERGSESFELRRAFYELRGRQTAFWAPLWTRGMRPLVAIGAAETTITIPYIGYSDKYTSEHIFIRDAAGNVYARAVTASVNNGNDTETLTIDSALGVTLPVRNVRMLCRLLFCRILADRIEIQHRAGVGPKIVLPLEEVPFFTDDYLSPSVPPQSDLGSDDDASDDQFSDETFSDSNITSQDIESDADILSDEIDSAQSELDIGSDAIESELDGQSDEDAGILSDDMFSDDQLSDDPASDDAVSDGFVSDDEASDDAESDAAAGVSRSRYNLPSGYTNVAAGVTLEWGSAVINEIGLSVDGADDSRIVINADGYYQIYAHAVWEGISGLGLLGGPLIRILIDGATDYPGIGGEAHNGGTNSTDPFTYYGRGGQTALIYLAAGQYFQVSTQFGGAPNANVVTVGASAYTHVTVRRLTSVTGALTYLTANETGASNTTFNWDAEEYDSGSVWTSGANHVAPSGPSKVSACANWLVGSLAVEWGTRILINGSSAARMFKSSGSNTPYSSFDSGPMVVSAADTIAADITSNDASFTHSANSTSLATEFHSDDSIRLTLTADLTTINAETSGPYAIGWTSVTEDSIGLFSAGTPTRIPLPDGWVKAGAVIAPSAFGINDTTQIRISHYNSSNTLLEVWLSDMFISTRTDLRLPVMTGEIEASAGDYLVVSIEAEGDTSITILAASYAWVRAYS